MVRLNVDYNRKQKRNFFKTFMFLIYFIFFQTFFRRMLDHAINRFLRWLLFRF